MYWGGTQEMIPMSFVTDATCVAYDWLGLKLYWSAYRNGVVRFDPILLMIRQYKSNT